MYKAIIVALAVAVFACIQLSNAAVPGAVDLRSLLPLRDPSYEIRDGNCTNATMATLVYQEHVHKTRVPFTTREAMVEWFGDETIYCVMALSEKEASKGSTVEIVKGGVGHNFVSLQMKSAKNHGLEYNVQVVQGNCSVAGRDGDSLSGKGYIEMTGIDPETSKDICEIISSKLGK